MFRLLLGTVAGWYVEKNGVVVFCFEGLCYLGNLETCNLVCQIIFQPDEEDMNEDSGAGFVGSSDLADFDTFDNDDLGLSNCCILLFCCLRYKLNAIQFKYSLLMVLDLDSDDEKDDFSSEDDDQELPIEKKSRMLIKKAAKERFAFFAALFFSL